MDPTFFSMAAEMGEWFTRHGATAKELLVGFYKRGSGFPSVTRPESVDEALCVGWIDGIVRTLDDRRYTVRFTPRRKGSIWSAFNIRRVEILTAEGRMLPAGLQAFAARRENRSGIYAYEQQQVSLPEPYAGLLKANATAWEFFEMQPASYRQKLGWWVVSAKQEATRLRRLELLIINASEGQRMPRFD